MDGLECIIILKELYQGKLNTDSIGGGVRLDRGWGSDCGLDIVYHYIERIMVRKIEHRLDRGFRSD